MFSLFLGTSTSAPWLSFPTQSLSCAAAAQGATVAPGAGLTGDERWLGVPETFMPQRQKMQETVVFPWYIWLFLAKCHWKKCGNATTDGFRGINRHSSEDSSTCMCVYVYIYIYTYLCVCVYVCVYRERERYIYRNIYIYAYSKTREDENTYLIGSDGPPPRGNSHPSSLLSDIRLQTKNSKWQFHILQYSTRIFWLF